MFVCIITMDNDSLPNKKVTMLLYRCPLMIKTITYYTTITIDL